MTKVMVFGVFDGLHQGHRTFLQEAKSQGDYLIAIVAQDHIVEHLKGHLPTVNIAERLEHLRQEDNVDEVIIGDAELGTWQIVEQHHPDIIAIGYDQHSLKEDLEAYLKNLSWKPDIKVMKSFEPTSHGSLIK